LDILGDAGPLVALQTRPVPAHDKEPSAEAGKDGVMTNQVVFLDRFEVAEGKSKEFQRYAQELVDLVQEQEPGATSYGWYLDQDGRRGTAVFVFVDAASFDRYLDLASPRFRHGVDLTSSTDIELLGRASDRATEMAKAFNATLKSELVGLHR
jgi:quinol monooxygenase YgiN